MNVFEISDYTPLVKRVAKLHIEAEGIAKEMRDAHEALEVEIATMRANLEEQQKLRREMRDLIYDKCHRISDRIEAMRPPEFHRAIKNEHLFEEEVTRQKLGITTGRGHMLLVALSNYGKTFGWPRAWADGAR